MLHEVRSQISHVNGTSVALHIGQLVFIIATRLVVLSQIELVKIVFHVGELHIKFSDFSSIIRSGRTLHATRKFFILPFEILQMLFLRPLLHFHLLLFQYELVKQIFRRLFSITTTAQSFGRDFVTHLFYLVFLINKNLFIITYFP